MHRQLLRIIVDSEADGTSASDNPVDKGTEWDATGPVNPHYISSEPSYLGNINCVAAPLTAIIPLFGASLVTPYRQVSYSQSMSLSNRGHSFPWSPTFSRIPKELGRARMRLTSNSQCSSIKLTYKYHDRDTKLVGMDTYY